MQNKTLLAKIVGVVALVCLALAMSFGLVACNNDKQLTKDDKVVASVVLSGDKFQVTYVDGTASEYAVGSVKDIKVLENGQTQITYADGTKATVGDANCNHAFTASADVKPASCCEKGVKIQVCEKCGYVESVEIEKDPEIHGEWVLVSEIEYGDLEQYVDEDEGIIYYDREDNGWSVYQLVTHYECGSMTILEGYSGVGENCFEATCALCGEVFAAGHAPVDEWENIVVDDANVNICENEHTVYKTCPICKAVLLYDDNGVIVSEKEPALGHIYGEPIIGDKNTNANPNYYPVTLHCERCGEDQTVRAYAQEDGVVNVPADCRNDGYAYVVYEYSYTNYVDGVETVLTETIDLEHQEFESTGEHTAAEGIMFYAYSIAEGNEEEYIEDLKALFDNNTIRWSEGVPADCVTHNPAVFTCTVCGEQIVIALSGEHTFGAETVVPATCTEDGYSYKTCADCGYRWVYDEVEATGHNFVYVNNSYDDGYASFRCTKCGEIFDEVEVEVVAEHAAQDCRSKSYTTYEAELYIGIDNETQVVTFNVYSDEDVMYHTIKANTAQTQYMKFAAYNIAAQGPEYDYNDQIKSFFEENLIRWSEGVPANCATYMPAVFTCTVCREQIVIALSGEHKGLNENDTDYDAPTCTERGFLYMFCEDCDNYILQEAYDAVGHNFVPDADSWDNFVNGEKAGAAVVFNCKDCEEQITLYAKETIIPSTVGCVTTDTYKYDFYTAADNTTTYTYNVETAEGTYKTLTFKYSWNYAVSEGSHLIGKYEGSDVRVVAFNLAVPEDNQYEYLDKFDYFFKNGTLAWNEGEPATCSNYALAVFTCATCGEKVVFQLSGEHTFSTDPDDIYTEQPTCEEGGYTEVVCTACGEWIRTEETEALGHDYGEWTLEGGNWLKAAEENGEVYINDGHIYNAKCVCSRCDSELVAEPDEAASMPSLVLPTCGEDGKITIVYKYGDDTVYVDTVIIPMIDHHLTDIWTAERVVKWADDGKYYLGYVCDDCGMLVVYAKSANEAVIDAIIAELTADYVDELMGRA